LVKPTDQAVLTAKAVGVCFGSKDFWKFYLQKK
jgi:hypothetical protein